MNPELSYIHAQCHRQDLLRAAQQEHRFEVSRSRSRQQTDRAKVLNVGVSRPWRELVMRRAAVGKA